MKILTALTVLVLATPALGQTVTFRTWTDHDGVTRTQFSDGTLNNTRFYHAVRDSQDGWDGPNTVSDIV